MAALLQRADAGRGIIVDDGESKICGGQIHLGYIWTRRICNGVGCMYGVDGQLEPYLAYMVRGVWS